MRPWYQNVGSFFYQHTSLCARIFKTYIFMCTYIPNIHVYVDQVIRTNKHVLSPPYMSTRNRVLIRGERTH